MRRPSRRSASTLLLDLLELVDERVGVPELVRKDIGPDAGKEDEEDEDADDVRPDVHELVVAGKEALEYAPARIVVNAVASMDIQVVDRVLLGVVYRADVRLKTRLDLKILLANLLADFRGVYFQVLGPVRESFGRVPEETG